MIQPEFEYDRRTIVARRVRDGKKVITFRTQTWPIMCRWIDGRTFARRESPHTLWIEDAAYPATLAKEAPGETQAYYRRVNS